MFFCSSGYTIIYQRAQMLRLWLAAPPRKPSKKGWSDFSRLWYVLYTANSRAQDVDEPLGTAGIKFARRAFDAVFSFTRIVWKGIGCGGDQRSRRCGAGLAVAEEAVLEKAIFARLLQAVRQSGWFYPQRRQWNVYQPLRQESRRDRAWNA